MDKLAVVILHYEESELTKYLYRQLTGQGIEIFVFDNNAPKPFPDAWKRSSVNLHWVGAFAVCLAEMETQGFSHLWFLNNDITFFDSASLFKRLTTRHAWISRQAGKVGLYSPAFTQNPYHTQMVARKNAQFSLVPYIDGIAPLVNLRCWREVGGLDSGENLYGYGVDVWFSFRVFQAGWNVVVDHQILARHKYHSTSGQVDGYLLKAAQAEQIYLESRMGIDYRWQLKRMAEDVRVFDMSGLEKGNT